MQIEYRLRFFVLIGYQNHQDGQECISRSSCYPVLSRKLFQQNRQYERRLTYKEYMGSVHYCAEVEVFYGKIEGIENLVSFEGKSVDALKAAFEESVENYLDICKRNNKDAEKSYKGSFNVRVSPELHRKAKRTAVKMGLSLNQFM